MGGFREDIDTALSILGVTGDKQVTPKEIYNAVSQAAMKTLFPRWKEAEGKRACYLSMEFLVGRLVQANLLNMGLLDEAAVYLREKGFDISQLEEVPDAALGNGGLGRLAACFLDSAATHELPLDGFGLRFRYGLFEQWFDGSGDQRESADDWLRYGDPWSVRREEEAVLVRMRDLTVRAVPYDMPVIGYGGKTVNTLRLWQAEPEWGFDFSTFNAQKYTEARREENRAADITAVLYPNDDTDEGRRLRLTQQYFLVSATLQTLIRRFVKTHGESFDKLTGQYAIQLNDTHPVLAIPELLRILMSEYQMRFDDALPILREVFAYTNHTVMPEALESWDINLFISVLPEVYPYVVMLQNELARELKQKNASPEAKASCRIIRDGRIFMAPLAVYGCHSTNGVAKIHTEILKEDLLKEWNALYPGRVNNKTNGITQRRWLLLCNPELSEWVTGHIGSGWVTDLNKLQGLKPLQTDASALCALREIKRVKKVQLCREIQQREGVTLNPDWIFDIQVKRMHEYKRQLLNAFSLMDIYFGIKAGRIRNFTPMVCLFGGKAAAGYGRAKAIIRYINAIAALVNSDPEVNKLLQVLFVRNYNVSYAEKLIPAADISEQISPAGTEASGTGNMKFMLNGAVTLGTLDGANVEIVEQAGIENNYIFGLTVDEVKTQRILPREIYGSSTRIKRVVDTLIDGTFSDGGSGLFRELYMSLVEHDPWRSRPDNYFLLQDFESYCDRKLDANRDTLDRDAFTRKQLINIASAGVFSSDRTIKQYASEIWSLAATGHVAGDA